MTMMRQQLEIFRKRQNWNVVFSCKYCRYVYYLCDECNVTLQGLCKFQLITCTESPSAIDEGVGGVGIGGRLVDGSNNNSGSSSPVGRAAQPATSAIKDDECTLQLSDAATVAVNPTFTR